MKKLKLFFVLGAILIAGAIFHSCQKETPDNLAQKGSKMVMGTYSDCNECIDLTETTVEYYEKTASQTVNWGTKATPFSKDVDIVYYNTEDNFVLKVLSTNGWSDLIIDEVSSWTNGPVAPDVYGEYIVPLPVGWQACDDYNFSLQVAGNGPQAVFTIEYKLIGVCCAGCPGTVTDIDNNVYNVVKIGDQCWMKENLRTSRYNNETPVQFAQDAEIWPNLTTPGYCWYHNFTESDKLTYGALYNWYAVNEGNLCPTGWHVPSDADWKILEMELGMTQAQADAPYVRGTDEGEKMKETGVTHWLSGNVATNSSGFTALGAGCRQTGGLFNLLFYQGMFWSTTEYIDEWEPQFSGAWTRSLYFGSKTVDRHAASYKAGYSVRCVKD
jgi:uncharacterized protein (TIGR02145 family)